MFNAKFCNNVDATNFILTTPDQLKSIVLESVAVAFQHHRPTVAPATGADEPLTPGEAATLFRTSKVSLWSWEKKGIIKGYHLGNKKYFLRNELMAALTKREDVAV